MVVKWFDLTPKCCQDIGNHTVQLFPLSSKIDKGEEIDPDNIADILTTYFRRFVRGDTLIENREEKQA